MATELEKVRQTIKRLEAESEREQQLKGSREARIQTAQEALSKAREEYASLVKAREDATSLEISRQRQIQALKEQVLKLKREEEEVRRRQEREKQWAAAAIPSKPEPARPVPSWAVPTSDWPVCKDCGATLQADPLLYLEQGRLEEGKGMLICPKCGRSYPAKFPGAPVYYE